MNKNLLRYRARTEWDGIELFDRKEGKVLPPGKESMESIEQGNVEPLIDTPFDKTPYFASAPRRIYWELTRKCNLNCRACFNRFSGSREEMSSIDILNINIYGIE